ncbi:MAG: Ig-like domain repeat protein [Terriglobales bacterium]
MKGFARLLSRSVCLVFPLLTQSFAFAGGSSANGYLITNNDNSPGIPNTATFYSIASNGQLSAPTVLILSGQGTSGGYFAADRASVEDNATSQCAYLSEGSTNTIAGVEALTQTVVGDFPASANDNGFDNGIGLVMSNNYLYASFSTSGTLATFAVLPGCQLQFLGDIAPAGLAGGSIKGMATFGNLLVVAYGDGSIESFNIASGVPVSNGDEQNAAGFAIDEFPSGVVITPDGQWAIFGDDASGAAVEVSDLSSGQLAPTVLYSFPSGLNSNNVLLSSDATLLYITNNTSGQVTAAFFDTATGIVTYGCISAPLNGFDSTFAFLSGLVAQPPPSAGSVLYVAELGHPSAIGVVNVTSSGGSCTLQEASGSPVTDASNSLLSIAVAASPGTTTAVASSLNPSQYGQSVSFTATVTGNSPTGSVQFNIDSSAFGPPVTLVSGSASSAGIATLSVGKHTVAAVYSGDANNQGSTGMLSGGQVVNQASQTIIVTVPAPATAVPGTSFTIAASASSSLPIAFTHSGPCTNSNATYTINTTAKPGTICTVTMNQAGNVDYAPAPTVNETTTVVKAISPTVSFTGAPASATCLSSFAVTASSTNDPSVPTIASTGPCSLSNTVTNGTTVSETVTITSGTGTCALSARWAASGSYSADTATQKTKAQKATPLISFTGAPAQAANGTHFVVTAASNESGTGAAVPTITAAGSCTVGPVTSNGPSSYQATATMTKSTGTCTTKADWATTTDYLSASATQTTRAGP